MPEPSLIARQRVLLRDLIEHAAERAHGEPAIAAAFQEQVDHVEIEFAEAREALESRRTRELEENERHIEQARSSIEARYKAAQEAAHREFVSTRGKILERDESEKEAAQAAYKEACWTIAAVLEGAKNETEKELRENKSRLQTRLDELHDIHKQARAQLAEWKQPADEIEADSGVSAPKENAQPPKLSECVVEARQLFEQLHKLVVPRWAKSGRLALLIFLLWLVLIAPLGYVAGMIMSRD
jgi:hypothetical protein